MSNRPDSPFFSTPAYGRPKGQFLDHPAPQPDPQATAYRRQLSLTPGRCLRTRVAGVFLFLPLLARLRFDDMVVQAGYPGSGMVPAPSALLSLLTLKLGSSKVGPPVDYIASSYSTSLSVKVVSATPNVSSATWSNQRSTVSHRSRSNRITRPPRRGRASSE
jgi:hypothetical protein